MARISPESWRLFGDACIFTILLWCIGRGFWLFVEQDSLVGLAAGVVAVQLFQAHLHGPWLREGMTTYKTNSLF